MPAVPLVGLGMAGHDVPSSPSAAGKVAFLWEFSLRPHPAPADAIRVSARPRTG